MSISEIELSVPPGGGLASAQTVTITVAESDSGQGLRTTWNQEGRMHGADLTVALLPEGETYGNRIPLFTGKVDSVAWRAGTHPGEGVGTIIAVDETLHSDIQVPETVLTVETFANLPEQWRGAILPLIYGNSASLGIAPLLMRDSVSLTYVAADHPLGSMGTTHAVAGAQGTRTIALAGAATSTPEDALMALARPVTDNRYAIGGQTQELSRTQDVTDAAFVFDNDAATIAIIGTFTLNEFLDGQGRLAVKYTWPNPDGANTAVVTLVTHRRNPGALHDTLISAELIVRSIDPVTNAIQRDNLFRHGPYRHSSHVRTTEVTIAPLAIVSPAALEVEIEVLNEFGLGHATDVWYVGDLRLELFFQADSLFTPIFLADPWEGRADADGSITGTPGATILHAVDVLHSLLTDRLALPAQPAAFPAIRTSLTTYLGGLYRFDFGLGSGGWHQAQMSASQLLDTLALQAGCYLFPAGDGSITIARARDTMVSQLALTVSNMANVQVDLGRLDLVHSTYEIRYAWSVLLGRFTKVARATPEGSNHPDAATAVDLFLKCNDSFDRYGPQQPYILPAFGIQDDATAFTLLARLVNYHWTQQCIVTCDLPFVGIHLEAVDYVTITHPELPLNENGAVFEIVRLTHRPEDGNATSWPLQIVALRTALGSFDYLGIKDQSGVTWYWWINRAGELDWSLTPPSIATRVAVDLALSPLPYWFEVLDPEGNSRWIFPTSLTGEPDVMDTEPAVGTGQVGSPEFRGQGLGRYFLDVPLSYEVRVASVRPLFDYFAIKDQLGVVWYWWINRAGELEPGLNPPTLNARIALDLALSPIPSWLVVADPTPATRYIYPSSIDGGALVSATVPAVGTGYTGSPTVRGMEGGVWQLDVTAGQEVIKIAV